jgi:hypothetical protein
MRGGERARAEKRGCALDPLPPRRQLIHASVIVHPSLASRSDGQPHHFPIEIVLSLQDVLELGLQAGQHRVSQPRSPCSNVRRTYMPPPPGRVTIGGPLVDTARRRKRQRPEKAWPLTRVRVIYE